MQERHEQLLDISTTLVDWWFTVSLRRSVSGCQNTLASSGLRGRALSGLRNLVAFLGLEQADGLPQRRWQPIQLEVRHVGGRNLFS